MFNVDEMTLIYKDMFARYDNITKNSHFVKKSYLKLWSNNGEKIKVSIKGAEYVNNDLQSVCVEKYMYKVEGLNKFELDLVKSFYQSAPEPVKVINDDYLNDLQISERISDLIEGESGKKLIEKMKIQYGEDLQTNYENAFTTLIKESLLNLSDDFLKNDDEKLNFIIYLFSQYLRTQKHKNKIIENCDLALKKFNVSVEFNPEKLWKVLITILTNMASYKLFLEQDLHIKFIVSTKDELLTSDQPIINIANNIDVDPVEFYYPVTPKIGIIFPVKSHEICTDDNEMIMSMNNKIIENSVRFVFKK